jgi:hypothetical protein
VPALSPHRLASLLPVFLGVIICAVLAGSRLRLHSAPALRYAPAAALLRVRRSSREGLNFFERNGTRESRLEVFGITKARLFALQASS